MAIFSRLLAADDVMFAAASLVGFRCADHDDRVVVAGWFPIDEALRAAGIFPAYCADSVQFGHFFGKAHQRRERTARLLPEAPGQPPAHEANATHPPHPNNFD